MRELELKYHSLIECLLKSNITISTMESCTGGFICSMLTDIEGASGTVRGGIVAYSNEIKEEFGIDSATIERYGVYSSECALEMAMLTSEKFNTDIGIGVTGTFGNVDPNNNDSVPGIIYIATTFNHHIKTKKIEITAPNRHGYKEKTAEEVLNLVTDIIS